LHGFHVRLGSMAGTHKKMRQKKVDVLLAVEMLDNAFRKNMDVAVLIAGDADFVPVIEAVMRLGTWVEVCYHRSGASEELFSAADHAGQFTFHDLWNWSFDEFQRQHPLPIRSLGIHYDVVKFLPRNLKTGKNTKGEAITAAERGTDLGEFFIYEHAWQALITYSNRDVLEKYYIEQFGNIMWDTYGHDKAAV
jgi:NYN domain